MRRAKLLILTARLLTELVARQPFVATDLDVAAIRAILADMQAVLDDW